MTAKVYALLVGIDTYQAPVSPLSGCVADIEAWHDYLQARVGRDGQELHAVVLRNEEATRQAVIDNFLGHLGQAGKEDTVLFCYSGHGSQCRTAPEFFHLEPDRLDETLVCYDSREDGNFDLADKEIAKLIAEVAKNDPHIVLVLDSCHSGSATRNLDAPGVRRVPTDSRQRPASSYLVTARELGEMTQTRSATGSESGWMQLPRGRHIVLSACQPHEEAKETRFNGQQHGVFSHYLMDTLQGAHGDWTYRDLFSRVSAMVRSTVSQQSPVIEATDLEDLDRPFLGGAIQSLQPYFTLEFDDAEGWVMNGGTIHGVGAVLHDDSTRLAVFPVDATDLDDLQRAVGTARVVERQPARSRVDFVLEAGDEPDPFTIYKAVITSQPVPPLGVKLEGDAAALQLVRAALERAGANAVQVSEVQVGEDLRLSAEDESYRLSRAGDDRPLFAFVQGWSPDRADQAVEHMAHIGRWMRMARLSNGTSKLAPNAVRIECYRVLDDNSEELLDPAETGSDIRLEYEYSAAEHGWKKPRIRLKITNDSERRLYCMLFDLTDRFAITPGLLEGGGEWLDPGQSVWAKGRRALPVSVPDELWNEGMTEYRDLLKVVACTEPCEATRFRQDKIGVRYERPATRGAAGMNSLERLMGRTMTRDIGDDSEDSVIADWTTAELGITTVRPLEGAAVPEAGGRTELSPHLRVAGHPQLRANISLSTVPLSCRDAAGAPPLPAWLRDAPACVQPFQLAPSRSVEAGLSVLELTEVSNHATVTPEQPLTLALDAQLDDGEHLLTVAWDAESGLYLPLGRATATDAGVEVRLERLPAPSSSRRSLTGSIKIFFQKVISERLGRDFEYPLLRMADPAGGYIADLDEIRARVDASSRILLYIHGITGDTRGMVKSAFHQGHGATAPPLGERYDLVLAYDYENLNTEIQGNARALQERLAQVGLAGGHGKSLHIVAHSMGGLVSRWFIEHLGGNEVVEHLVMLGTPNGGSPWATVEDWVAGAIGIGLNGLSNILWPAEVLGALLEKFESAVGVSLAQMEPGSEFLEDLAGGTDPAVRYSIVAGNTSLLAGDLQPDAGGKSRVQRLLERLNLQRFFHTTASLAFFGAPNDVAASVVSITSVPAGFARLDPPREVECDHMSYFATAAGLRALSEALD